MSEYTLEEQRNALLIDLAASLEREDALKVQRDELLAALEYHQEQTRPIQRTIDAIAKVKP